MTKKRVMITGGLGFIGSHITATLIPKGYSVCIVDNLSNSSIATLHKLETLVSQKIPFFKADICNLHQLSAAFAQSGPIDVVIHCAGLKSISESLAFPLRYYDNNVSGTVTLLQVMERYNTHHMVFSSSAAVYEMHNSMPLSENASLGEARHPYGQSKFMVEQILDGLVRQDNKWNATILRYFNPVGAHPSGVIGESLMENASNLVPNIMLAALGHKDALHVYGLDYPTHDGSAIRDYIHIMDLADGHVKAIEKPPQNGTLEVFNLGTGKGYSVLEVLKTFEKISGKTVPVKFRSRREGDVAQCWADVKKAKLKLDWQSRFCLENMLFDMWRWLGNSTVSRR